MASFRRPDCTCANKKKCTCGAKWEYRIRYKDPVTQEFKEKSKRGFKTKREAQLEAAKVEQEIENNTYISDNSITFQKAFDEWWPAHSKRIKPSTQYTVFLKFQKHILPWFGSMKLKDITKGYCQKMIDEMSKQLKSVRDIKIYTSLVFRYAVGEGYIHKNPMDHVIMPKKESEFLAGEEDKNFWTKDEIKKFYELAKENMDIQNFIMFHLLLYTGMRKGELISLEWDDVDLSNQTISINKTIFFHEGKEILQKVKTYQSRTIYIDENTTKLLQKWSIQQREWLLGNGINATPKNIITRPDLRPLRMGQPNDILDKFIKKHDLEHISIHGFRHTHASILFEAGATIKEVQDRLGHKDIKTTMNIYTHVTRGVKEKTADIFQKYLNL